LLEAFGGGEEDERLWKGYQILGTDEIPKSNTIIVFLPALKFDTLSCSSYFLRMPKFSWQWQFAVVLL
jgi:hypothetical protein